MESDPSEVFTVTTAPVIPGRLVNGYTDNQFYVRARGNASIWYGPYADRSTAFSFARDLVQLMHNDGGLTLGHVEWGKRYWIAARKRWYLRSAAGEGASGYSIAPPDDFPDAPTVPPPPPLFGMVTSENEYPRAVRYTYNGVNKSGQPWRSLGSLFFADGGSLYKYNGDGSPRLIEADDIAGQQMYWLPAGASHYADCPTITGPAVTQESYIVSSGYRLASVGSPAAPDSVGIYVPRPDDATKDDDGVSVGYFLQGYQARFVGLKRYREYLYRPDITTPCTVHSVEFTTSTDWSTVDPAGFGDRSHSRQVGQFGVIETMQYCPLELVSYPDSAGGPAHTNGGIVTECVGDTIQYPGPFPEIVHPAERGFLTGSITGCCRASLELRSVYVFRSEQGETLYYSDPTPVSVAVVPLTTEPPPTLSPEYQPRIVNQGVSGLYQYSAPMLVGTADYTLNIHIDAAGDRGQHRVNDYTTEEWLHFSDGKRWIDNYSPYQDLSNDEKIAQGVLNYRQLQRADLTYSEDIVIHTQPLMQWGSVPNDGGYTVIEAWGTPLPPDAVPTAAHYFVPYPYPAGWQKKIGEPGPVHTFKQWYQIEAPTLDTVRPSPGSLEVIGTRPFNILSGGTGAAQVYPNIAPYTQGGSCAYAMPREDAIDINDYGVPCAQQVFRTETARNIFYFMADGRPIDGRGGPTGYRLSASYPNAALTFGIGEDGRYYLYNLNERGLPVDNAGFQPGPDNGFIDANRVPSLPTIPPGVEGETYQSPAFQAFQFSPLLYSRSLDFPYYEDAVLQYGPYTKGFGQTVESIDKRLSGKELRGICSLYIVDGDEQGLPEPEYDNGSAASRIVLLDGRIAYWRIGYQDALFVNLLDEGQNLKNIRQLLGDGHTYGFDLKFDVSKGAEKPTTTPPPKVTVQEPVSPTQPATTPPVTSQPVDTPPTITINAGGG